MRKAMAEADAAGLRPPPGSRPWEDRANLTREEGLDLRRHAIAGKRAQEKRQLEFHRKAVELLLLPDERGAWVKAQALETVQMWEDRRLCSPHYVEVWRALLDLPADYARREILREDDFGVSMRCNTPFGFLGYVLDDEP